MAGWRSLRVEAPDEHGVALLFLNRPARSNALDSTFFTELPLAISQLDASPAVRVIILAGSGKNFCSGIDLSSLAQLQKQEGASDTNGSHGDAARINERNLRSIKLMQAALTSLEDCRKPIIAAIHGACIGAGVDLITACDLRYCSSDAYFSVREVDLAIVADLGTLQRLPGVVGHARAMELALTGRNVSAEEAKMMGLVHDVFESKEATEEQVNVVGHSIAAKSPLAVFGTKRVLLKSRDLSIADGLDYVATWNSAMLLSSDLKEAVQAQVQKRRPAFSKLEKEKLSPGDVMKAVIRPGEGNCSPKKGDLVLFHYTTRTSFGVVVESTRLEHGGGGRPKKVVMGKTKMIRGWEEGIPTMTKGEVAMLKVKPEFHYGDKEYQEMVPDDYPKSEELTFEIEIMDFFPIKVVADDLGVLKRVLKDGEGWETARQPYEVKVWPDLVPEGASVQWEVELLDFEKAKV